jgi:parallel beta-helix repeat protein
MRRLGILLVPLLLLADAYGATKKPSHRVGSDDDRGCCGNGKEIKKIRKTALGIETIVEEIADLIDALDCSDSAIDGLQDQVNDINSLVDALLENGGGCCGLISTSLSFADIINAEIGEGAGSLTCCDTVSEIQSVLSIIDSKVDFIGTESCCNEVVQIASILDSIENKLLLFDTIDTAPCTATPITSPTPTTIGTSGHYCLTTGITGDSSAQAVITIDAADVYLDLNGQTVTMIEAQAPSTSQYGIEITSGNANIVITNGFIISSAPAPMTAYDVASAGIFAAVTNNVVIKNVTVSGLGLGENGGDVAEGIYLATASNMTVDNVIVSGFAFDSIVLDNSTNCIVSNSTFYGNGLTGVFITDGSEWNLIENCVAKQMHLVGDTDPIFVAGFQIDSGCSNNTISSCVSDSNGAGTGFLLGASTGSYAAMNAVGAGNVVLRCTASGNPYGFFVVSDTARTQLIKECIAINNDTGFAELPDDPTMSIIEFVSNAAVQNTIDYDDPANPVYHTPESVNHSVSTSTGPSYWSNIFTQ